MLWTHSSAVFGRWVFVSPSSPSPKQTSICAGAPRKLEDLRSHSACACANCAVRHGQVRRSGSATLLTARLPHGWQVRVLAARQLPPLGACRSFPEIFCRKLLDFREKLTHDTLESTAASATAAEGGQCGASAFSRADHGADTNGGRAAAFSAAVAAARRIVHEHNAHAGQSLPASL